MFFVVPDILSGMKYLGHFFWAVCQPKPTQARLVVLLGEAGY